jgi:hypothetical protein
VLDLLVDVLACHRATRLVVEDAITKPLREKIFKKYPPHEESWSYVFTCPWCTSVWIGAGIVAARAIAPKAWDPVARLLALSSATGLIMERVA